jgi:broad specificity phosphatase PhoE
MKTIYFLRHGQTMLNKGFQHQGPEAMLSDKGRFQAQQASQRLADESFDIILTSPLIRAKQTADVVSLATGKPVEACAVFEELRRPRELFGKHWLSPQSLSIMSRLYMNAGKDNWHYSDEENLEEFHARSRRALEYLVQRPEEKILVVTHRGLMAALKERILHDGMDSKKQYRHALIKNVTIGNCCYLTAVWTPKGENGDTLDGTWALSDGVTCPAGNHFDFGLG